MWDGDLTGELVDGRYALGSLYGSGGMAEVYEAVDTRLDRTVAIKFFQGSASAEDRIRLDREVQVLASLHCPGLVEVYGTGAFRGRPFFVMQAVEGGTLRRRMRGAMSPEVVAAIGAQIAGVLAHVHANDVVHRDVKPSNILLDCAGRRAYLADFGLALQAQVTRVTRSGILVGTAGYLAPEQVRGGDVLPAADVYALGLVLLECLTGRPEYPGGDTEAALSRLHREPRIPVNLPEPWIAALTAMTASDPARRPSAAESERLLDEARVASVGLKPLAEVEVVERPAVEDEEGTPAPARGNRVLLVGAGVAAVLLSVVGYLVLGGQAANGPGDRPAGPGTTTADDQVAEQVRQPGGTGQDTSSVSTVTVVRGVPVQPPAGSSGDDQPVTDGTVTLSSAEGTTTSKPVREPPIVLPTRTPVVIAPTPSPPTEPPTDPDPGKRGGASRG